VKKHSFSIYNASAGSGKTYTLVKEYLKIILVSPNVDAYKNILAITFTNKAVHEMKSRIVDSLFDFTKDCPADKSVNLMKDIAVETGLSINEITAKAKSIIKNIIHNYAAFDISTIDKFTHKVIRSFAIDLNLPVTFDVSLDTENLLQEAVDSIVSEAGENEELTKLLVDFTMEKTDDDKSWDVSGEIFNTGKLILNENNREEVLSLQNKSIEEFVVLKNKLQEFCSQIEDETKVQAKLALELIEKKGIDLKSFSRGTFPNHLNYILSGDDKMNNHRFVFFEDISINQKAKDRAIIESIIPELLEILDSIYGKIQRKLFYKAFLKNITPLSLLNTVSNKLKNIQEEQNILSIAEFNKLINEQIQHQPAPFIYERLGERYKHFFIDEFQDTSQMQWENLIPLIDNALSSEDLQGNQGSLLIVGDPKQSIYRWRGGKAEQFIDLAKNENPFSNKDKKVINLESNYRSYDEVIHFNNNFFKFLSQKFENEDYKDLYENKSFQKSNTKKGGYVNITFLPKADEVEAEEDITQDQLYLQKTLQTISEVQQKGFSLSEIVVLVRNNSKGVLLANYLTEQEVSVISSESLLLSTSSEVQFLVNMLRYLNDKKNKEALVQVLYYLTNNFETHLPVHDFIWQGLQFGTETELQLWLQSFGIQIDFVSIRRKPLYEVVEDLILVGIPSSKNNAYVQYFLDTVLEKDVKFQYSMTDFLDFWEKSSHKLSVPTAEGAEAIRIMTIHKSKGLEFPVVIFPFAEENYSVNKREKMWLDAPEGEEASFEKYLIDKSSKVKDYGAEASKVYDQKSQEELLDNINVLYVALTRAEEQLYIISSWKDRNKQGNLPNNLASFFIEFVEDRVDFDPSVLNYTWGNSDRISKKRHEESQVEIIQPVTSSLVSENIKIAQREAMMWGSKQQEAIEFGNTMHEVLSFVKNKYDVDLAVAKALENGLISESQKEIVFQMLNDIVFHPELNDFFDEKSLVFNERTILKKGVKNHIPDRIVINKKDAYLLDYKTGNHNQKYITQILEYENALNEMGFSIQKKSLVYIGEKIEVVNL
jgi:ATP-dependent exoDNAse (exonuclease V) beta subunit